MKVHIFILCYNEEVLLPYTIMHYKTYLPNCNITIYDNYSTDNSVKIAKSLNCNILQWKTDDPEYEDSIDDNMYIKIKNNCWKDISDGWIIMCDMDEWLCVTEEQLKNEENQGTSLLNIKGYDIISSSNCKELTDIDLLKENEGIYHKPENKKLCFLRNKVEEMNYLFGAHHCYPEGNIKYSKKIYVNKHMNWLGLEFITDRYKKRYERIKNISQREGRPEHYTNDEFKIRQKYKWFFICKKVIEELE